MFLEQKGAQSHLSIAFWLKVKNSNIVDYLSLIKITASKIKIVEFGVNMITGSLYANYYPTSLKKNSLLTVTT